MTEEHMLKLWNDYFAAAEELYSTLGLASHGDTGEVVAFVTSGTTAAMERLHQAATAIMVSRGLVPPGSAS
jgi:hypothetical protein